jgi:hypothetical protein
MDNKILVPAKFHFDAGHGWLAVSPKLLDFVGFWPSEYSYFDRAKGIVYLEEDCDAITFIDKAKAKNIELVIVKVDDGDNSPIRRLSRMNKLN